VNKKRLLHIITGLNTGGAEHALYKVAASTLGDHWEMTVVSLMGEGNLGAHMEAAGIPVWCLDMPRGRLSARALFQLRQIIRATQPHVIHSWMYHANLVATLAFGLTRPGIPIAWNIRHSLDHFPEEKRTTRWVIHGNRLLSRHAAKIVYNSHVSRSQHKAFGFADGRADVIPNGFDLQRLSPSQEARCAVRKQFNIPHAAPLIGHVARAHPVKDHHTFLEALRQVLHANPDVHCMLIGRDVDRKNSTFAPWCSKLAPTRVHFLGERDDISTLMPALDVFCLSSRSEAFPNVLGEAMACGVPCVSTDVGDCAHVIGDTGLLVPPGDPCALATALKKLIRLPAARHQAIAQKARTRIAANFSLQAVTQQYRQLYLQLAESRH